MTQTTETSPLLTREQAKACTAELIEACPDWCTVSHDPDAHPEDVRHERRIGSTPIGTVSVYVYAIPMPGEKVQGGIDVAVDRIDEDGLSYDEAMDAARVLTQAATVLKLATERVPA
jgi:hypothetical protein